MPPRAKGRLDRRATTRSTVPPRPGHQELLDYLSTHSKKEAQERWQASPRTIGRWQADAEAALAPPSDAPDANTSATDVDISPEMRAAFTGAVAEEAPPVDVPAAPEPSRPTVLQTTNDLSAWAIAMGLIDALDAETRAIWQAGVSLASVDEPEYRDLGTRLQLKAFSRGGIPQALVEGLLARLA